MIQQVVGAKRLRAFEFFSGLLDVTHTVAPMRLAICRARRGANSATMRPDEDVVARLHAGSG
jgi:hypothetical protein